jgi:hypothetical protein
MHSESTSLPCPFAHSVPTLAKTVATPANSCKEAVREGRLLDSTPVYGRTLRGCLFPAERGRETPWWPPGRSRLIDRLVDVDRKQPPTWSIVRQATFPDGRRLPEGASCGRGIGPSHVMCFIGTGLASQRMRRSSHAGTPKHRPAADKTSVSSLADPRFPTSRGRGNREVGPRSEYRLTHSSPRRTGRQPDRQNGH